MQTCCDPPLQKLLSQSKSQTSKVLFPSLQSKIRLSGLRPAMYNSKVTVTGGRQAVSYWFLPGTLFQNITAASAEGCRAVHSQGAFLCPFLLAIRPTLNCNRKYHFKQVSSMANELFFFLSKFVIQFPFHRGCTLERQRWIGDLPGRSLQGGQPGRHTQQSHHHTCCLLFVPLVQLWAFCRLSWVCAPWTPA